MIAPIDMGIITPIMIVFCGVLMVVLRAGASRVFFDVVGTFQATKMMDDAEAAITTLNAIVIDGMSGMEEAGAMVAEQMQKIVEATVPLSHELEMATLEFQKFVTEAEGARLADEVREVGLQFGFTSNEALEAGARMAQLSALLGEDAVPAATEMALAFGLIGDMTPETAMQKLINLQQQTGFIYGESTKEAYKLLSAEDQVLQVRKEMANTLNTLNMVEDNSAATMSKITGVMNEFASQAHLAGEEISMMAAMSATLIEAGEEQGKGGRALRMIYARLGADTGGSATMLSKMGVEVKNADGSLRALSEILADLDPLWQGMNSGQKQTIAQMIAGNRHYVRFIKLAENYDRILTLNEATVGTMGKVYDETGEAVGFLSDMMDSNAVALDTARAKLELVNAQIGDFFIPTVVDATNFQVLFNEQILNMLEGMGGLGDVLQGFFEFQQIMSSTFAPFFSAVINVKAMNVALMTQRQIMRALSGEVLVAATKSATAKEEEAQATERQIILLRRLIEMTEEERLAHMTKAEQQQMADTERKGAMEQEVIDIHEIIAAIDKQGLAEKELAATTTKTRKYNKAVKELENFTTKRGIDLTSWATDKNKLHASTKDAVARKIEAVRIAQAELNLALEEEILILEREGNKIDERNADFIVLKETTGMATDEIRGHTLATELNTTAVEGQTKAIMGFSMWMMKIGMAFFVAEMLVMAFKDALPFVSDEAQAARIAVILMGMGMALMAAEMIFATTATFGATAATADLTATQKLSALWTSITSFSLSVQTVKTVAATIAMITLKAVMSIGFIAIAIGIAYAIDKYIVPKLSNMTEKAEESADSFAAASESAEDYAARVNDSMNSLDFSIFGEGADAMDEFANSREEMFFGFKAGETTGDLVKQVQQGGVENFIANTEVIMTNNFNGLTVPEMADEIISIIEQETYTKGTSLNLLARQ